MTKHHKDILQLLKNLNYSIRLPTLCWLGSDLFGLLDNRVRVVVSELKDLGLIKVDLGGWITVT